MVVSREKCGVLGPDIVVSHDNNNNGICSGISTRWLFIHCFQIELEFRNVDFCGGR